MSSENVIPDHDLPLWIKRARRRFDWGIIIILSFCVFIAWSFVENPDLSLSNNNIHDAFQIADTAESLEQGRLYPRWSPYAIGGLGTPLPHYTPPLPAYITALVQVLFTNDTIVAMRIMYVVVFIVAGLSMYHLVTQRVNAFAGLISALLYIFSPYFSLTIPHILGDLSQALALALLPLLLWSVSRLLSRNQAYDVVIVALTSASLLLTSPQHILLGFTLCIVLILSHQATYNFWRQSMTVLMAISIGIGIAAFYWIPAYYERDLVTWLPVTSYDLPFRIQLAELFAFTQQVDSGLMNPLPTFNLGWGIIIFVIMSMIAIFLRRGTRFQVLFLGYGLLLTVLGILFWSEATWLIGGIVFCFAISGGLIGEVTYPLSRRWRYIAWVISMLVIFLIATPIWVSEPHIIPIDGVTSEHQIQYETSTNQLALLPAGSMYPTTRPQERINFQSANIDNLFSNTGRFNSNADTRFTLAETGTHFARYFVFSDIESSVLYEQSYFPGWRVKLNGLSLPAERDDISGLTQITIPPVENGQLLISLDTMPMWIFAWILTVSMIVLGFVLGWRRSQFLTESFEEELLIPLGDVRLLMVVVVMLIILANLQSSQLRQEPRYSVQSNMETISNEYLQVQGYRLEKTTFKQNETFSLSLFWNLQPEVSESIPIMQTSIQLLDADTNRIIYESPKHPPGYFSTSLWVAGYIVEDRITVDLSQLDYVGDLTIKIQLWQCTPLCETPIEFDATSITSPSAIATISVVRP